MNPTLRDIAREVGVSQPVVSKVLNGGKAVGANASEKTRLKILKTAEQMGYRRHMGAVAMRQKRFNIIGLLMSTDLEQRSALPPGMLAGICDCLENKGMHLSIARMNDASLSDPLKTPRLLRELAVDGMLINYNRFQPAKMNALIKRSNLPAVWLNDKRSKDAVYPDDLDAGRRAAVRLMDLGHRRIRYVTQTPEEDFPHYSILDRCRGYELEMERAGLQADVVSSTQIKHWIQDFTDPARRAKAPTALITYSRDTMVKMIIAFTEHGLSVPGDCSLIGFCGEEFRLHKTITSLRVPEKEVGESGVKLLLRKYDQNIASATSLPIPHGWIEGETLAPPGL
ncbi:MAG: LacI family DNA-binding transcriptional regulator [Kiritimatiellia bacterium]